jgi:hypothetical protein
LQPQARDRAQPERNAQAARVAYARAGHLRRRAEQVRAFDQPAGAIAVRERRRQRRFDLGLWHARD